MTGDTFSPPQSGMHHLLVKLEALDLMATVTEIIAFLLQQQFRHNPVTKVTGITLLSPDHGMNIFHRQVLLGKLVMAVNASLFLKRPFLGNGWRG